MSNIYLIFVVVVIENKFTSQILSTVYKMLQSYDKQKRHISDEAHLILHQDASLPSNRAVKGCPCQLVFLLRHGLKVNYH